MKQFMDCYASAAGQNTLRNVSIYLQAFWHLGSRYVVRNMGLAGNGKNRGQARYGQQSDVLPVVVPATKQATEITGHKQAPLPSGALTEIRSFTAVSDSDFVAEQTAPSVRLTECITKRSNKLSINKWQQELGQMLPAVAGFCQQRWLVLLAPPCVPTEKELTAAGIDPTRVLLVHSTNANGFSVLQQALRSGTCGAVLAWLENSDEKNLEQLRQAAEAGNAWGVLFRTNKQNRVAQLEMAIA